MGYASLILASAPYIRLRMGESSGATLHDDSGNGLDFDTDNVTLGEPGALAGDANTAASFAQSHGFISVRRTPLDLSAFTAVSVEFFINVAAWPVSGDVTIFDSSDNAFAAAGSFVLMYQSASNQLVFLLNDAAPAYNYNLYSPPPISTGTYHHVVCVVNQAGTPGTNVLQLYVDGVLQTPSGGSSTAVTPGFHGATADKFWFLFRATVATFLDATLDEIAIYGYALSGAAVLAHYHASLGIFPIAQPVHQLRPRRLPLRRRSRFTRATPPPVNTLAVAQRAAGYYRVADPSLAGYELYRGVGASPDFTAGPWQTSATLPITTPALAAGTTVHLVLRQRNQWDLLSQNVSETIFDVDGGGVLTPTPPSACENPALTPAAAGTIRVSADYAYAFDGDNAADTFVVAYTVSAVTTTTTAAVARADGVAKLDLEIGPFAEGAVVTATITMRRTGTPNSDSTPSDTLTATATLLGPAAPTAMASLGEVAE